MGGTANGVERGIFHEGQRRRGSAGFDTMRTTLGDRRDCSRTPFHAGPRADCGPEPPFRRRVGASNGC
jgi:hypothetical protein